MRLRRSRFSRGGRAGSIESFLLAVQEGPDNGGASRDDAATAQLPQGISSLVELAAAQVSPDYSRLFRE
jgi:hypothetical protein